MLLWKFFSLITPLCRAPVLVMQWLVRTHLTNCLEHKQLNKLTFSVVVFPQETSESSPFLATSAWFAWSAQFSRYCCTLPGFQLPGIWQGRGLNSCGFRKQKVVTLI